MRKNSIKNGVIALIILSVTAKLIGVFYRIPLFFALGAQGMGLYQLVFPLYAFAISLVCGGCPIAVSRLVSISQSQAEKNVEKIVDSALVVFGGIGLLLSALLFGFSRYVSLFLGNLATKLPILAIAPSVFFSSIIAVFRGYNQGIEKSLKVGVSYIIEQALKLSGIALAFAFAKKGNNFAVVGAMLGITLGELITALYFTFSYFKNKKHTFSIDKKSVKELSSYGFTVSLNSIIFPLGSLLEGIIVVGVLSNSISVNATALYGLLSGVVSPLISMPSVINSSFCSWFLPKLCSAQKNKRREVFGAYAKIPLALSLAISISVAIFSKEILLILYPLNDVELSVCKKLLTVGSLTIFLSCALSLVSAYLQSENKPHYLTLNTFVAVAIKLALTPFALRSFSIYGAQVCAVLSYLIAFALGCFQSLKLGFGFSAKTLFSLFLSGVTFAFFACGIYLLVPTLLGCALAGVTALSTAYTVFSIILKPTPTLAKNFLSSVKTKTR